LLRQLEALLTVPAALDGWVRYGRRSGLQCGGQQQLESLLRAMRSATRIDSEIPVPCKKNAPLLKDNQRCVLKLLAELPPGQGLNGPQICAQMDIGQSTLTTHVMPILKQYYGVMNTPGVGYHLGHSDSGS
jgi:hypothetical protein